MEVERGAILTVEDSLTMLTWEIQHAFLRGDQESQNLILSDESSSNHVHTGLSANWYFEMSDDDI